MSESNRVCLQLAVCRVYCSKIFSPLRVCSTQMRTKDSFLKGIPVDYSWRRYYMPKDAKEVNFYWKVERLLCIENIQLLKHKKDLTLLTETEVKLNNFSFHERTSLLSRMLAKKRCIFQNETISFRKPPRAVKMRKKASLKMRNLPTQANMHCFAVKREYDKRNLIIWSTVKFTQRKAKAQEILLVR